MLLLIAESGPEMFKEDTGIDWVEFSVDEAPIAIGYDIAALIAIISLLLPINNLFS